MAKIEPLNSAQHGHLRMGAPQAADAHFVQVFATEFAAAATICPILFTKSPDSGAFYAGAMFGFKPGEPLVTADQHAHFRPLVTLRDGFFLSGDKIAIDAANSRFAAAGGDRLFEDGGEPSAALQRIQRVLGDIHAGIQATQAFIAALSAARLIEHIDVSLRFDDGERLDFQGLYTVSLDRLRDVDDPTALDLHRAGYLQLAYVMAASLKQIDRLAGIRNRRK